MKKTTVLKGLSVITYKTFEDNRGSLAEVYTKRDFINLGIKEEFVQDNFSSSKKGVFRGLHFQIKNTQSKLIRVNKGMGISVALDLRRESKTFGKLEKIFLSKDNRKMLYLPKGFAHGFLSLEDNTELHYKCSDYYNPEYEGGIYWLDKDINLTFELSQDGLSLEDIILSEKDKNLMSFHEFISSGIKL